MPFRGIRLSSGETGTFLRGNLIFPRSKLRLYPAPFLLPFPIVGFVNKNHHKRDSVTIVTVVFKAFLNPEILLNYIIIYILYIIYI